MNHIWYFKTNLCVIPMSGNYCKLFLLLELYMLVFDFFFVCLGEYVHPCIETSHCPRLSAVYYSSMGHNNWTYQPVFLFHYVHLLSSFPLFLFQRFMWVT